MNLGGLGLGLAKNVMDNMTMAHMSLRTSGNEVAQFRALRTLDPQTYPLSAAPFLSKIYSKQITDRKVGSGGGGNRSDRERKQQSSRDRASHVEREKLIAVGRRAGGGELRGAGE